MMINEFIFLDGTNTLKKVYCKTIKQAYEKLKFIYPNTYQFIKIKPGKSFKNFDDFLTNRK